jgi:hypothetical protein
MTPRRGPSELQPKFTAFSRCSAVRDFVAPLKRDRFAIIAVVCAREASMIAIQPPWEMTTSSLPHDFLSRLEFGKQVFSEL